MNIPPEKPSGKLVLSDTTNALIRALEGMEIAGYGVNDPPPNTPSRVALVRPNGNYTGGGKYSGYLLNYASTALSLTTNLTAAEIGNITGATEITIINAQEIGKSTHALTASPIVCSIFIGFRLPIADSNGKAVYMVNGIDLKACV